MNCCDFDFHLLFLAFLFVLNPFSFLLSLPYALYSVRPSSLLTLSWICRSCFIPYVVPSLLTFPILLISMLNVLELPLFALLFVIMISLVLLQTFHRCFFKFFCAKRKKYLCGSRTFPSYYFFCYSFTHSSIPWSHIVFSAFSNRELWPRDLLANCNLI